MLNRRNSLIAVGLALLAAVGGARAQADPPCPPTAPASALTSASQPLDAKLTANLSPFVVGGETAAEETSTVWIETSVGGGPTSYLCSGTLIGANRVLTAAHCVCPACRMIVGFGPNMRPPAENIRVNVVGVSLHPAYRSSGPMLQRGFDLAVLTIERYESCPAYRRTIPISAVAATVTATKLLVVGYGQTELPGVFGEKKRADVVMGSVTCTQGWAKRAGCVPFREFVLKGSAQTSLGGELGADTCNGDSGGPAFVVGERNARFLAGVTSRALIPKGGFQNEGCGFGGIYEYTGIPDVANWLRAVVPDVQIVTK